jgi:transposase
MTELRVHDLSVSLDGFGAGSARSEEHPLRVGGDRLHDWAFTHHARDPLTLAGGTTFHVVFDELHVVVVPVLLGSGERLFEPPVPEGRRCVEFTPSRTVAHVRLRRDR